MHHLQTQQVIPLVGMCLVGVAILWLVYCMYRPFSNNVRMRVLMIFASACLCCLFLQESIFDEHPGIRGIGITGVILSCGWMIYLGWSVHMIFIGRGESFWQFREIQ